MSATSAPSSAAARLAKEVKLVAAKPVPGVRFEAGGEDNPLEWTLFVDAPDEYVVGTERRKCPYAGRVFPVKVRFPDNYPFRAPELEFVPGMLHHPQVSKEGAVCSEDIAKAFGPTKNMTDIARLVQALLAQPNVDTAPEADIMAEMREKLPAYEERARKAAEKAPRKG